MYAKVFFLLICFIFGICAGGKLSQNGCGLEMPTDLPTLEPVLLYAPNSKASFALFKPKGKQNTLAKGSRLLLYCAGNNNVISTLNQQTVELYCGADGKFATVVGDVQYELKELGCSAIPTSTLRLTNEPCSAGKGNIFEAGFDVGVNDFYTVFTICYNNQTENTYYSYNVLNGATINYSVSQSNRRAFRANGMRFTTTATNNFYKTNNQISRLQEYFGKSQPFINDTSFLARGHLAPDADFIFSYEQLATYFYVNCAPEFQVVNAGNWVRVENSVRSFAGKIGDDLEIYTGTMGVLRLTHGAKKSVEIYVDGDKFIEAPLHYFKVIKHSATNSAIVMITVNNPFASAKDITELCENVCKQAGFDNPIFTDISRGYTYCCELSAFKKINTDLPKELTAANLLSDTSFNGSASKKKSNSNRKKA